MSFFLSQSMRFCGLKEAVHSRGSLRDYLNWVLFERDFGHFFFSFKEPISFSRFKHKETRKIVCMLQSPDGSSTCQPPRNRAEKNKAVCPLAFMIRYGPSTSANFCTFFHFSFISITESIASGENIFEIKSSAPQS